MDRGKVQADRVQRVREGNFRDHFHTITDILHLGDRRNIVIKDAAADFGAGIQLQRLKDAAQRCTQGCQSRLCDIVLPDEGIHRIPADV